VGGAAAVVGVAAVEELKEQKTEEEEKDESDDEIVRAILVLFFWFRILMVCVCSALGFSTNLLCFHSYTDIHGSTTVFPTLHPYTTGYCSHYLRAS
jgi:hypothetical protein